MWANAQRDGRPVDYRWRPLLNAAVWLTPISRVPTARTGPRPTSVLNGILIHPGLWSH